MAIKTDVVILAGGQGTRLRSVIGDDTPKPLALIHGRPFLDYLLDNLRQQGLQKFILASGYKSDKVETFAQRYAARHDVIVENSRELIALGTGGALRNALPLIESNNVLVLNGDSFLAMDYIELISFHVEKQAEISMALTRVDNVSRYGSVVVNADGKVSRFEEKNPANTNSGLINGGVYVFNRHAIENIKADAMVSLEQEVLPTVMGNGLYGKLFQGTFIDIGTPQSYQQASEIFR